MARDETVLEAAYHFAGHYGWPVFPVKRNKQPLTEHGLADASTEWEQLEAWWQHHPRAGVAIRTGAESFVALDVDVQHGGDDAHS